jgi:hypothetical protein
VEKNSKTEIHIQHFEENNRVILQLTVGTSCGLCSEKNGDTVEQIINMGWEDICLRASTQNIASSGQET